MNVFATKPNLTTVGPTNPTTAKQINKNLEKKNREKIDVSNLRRNNHLKTCEFS